MNVDFGFGFGYGLIIGSIISTLITNWIWYKKKDSSYNTRKVTE